MTSLLAMQPLSSEALLSIVSCVIVGAAMLAGTGARSQARAQSVDGPFDLPDTGVSGSAGFMAETYGASGISSRRPQARSEVFANLSFELLGLESGLNLLYSTESNSLRQSMNRLGFAWSWDWGNIEAGTVSPSYSKYSMNGATLRGGALQLTPGPLNVAFAAGRSQRAVAPSQTQGFRQPAFARWMYAGRVGVGAADRSHFHLVGTLARDMESSLSQFGNARPSENLTLTPDVGITLFDGAVSLQTEATVSAFTRDTRTEEVEPGAAVPDFLLNLYAPRVGTRVDYAGTSRLQLDLSPFTLDATYERVQPGFRSLGLSRVRSDQEVIRVNPRVELFGRRLSLGLNLRRTHNNLLDQRLATRQQRQIGGTVRARLSQGITLSGSYTRMVNEQTSESDSPLGQQLERRFVTHTASLAPTLTFRSGTTTHTLSLSGNAQRFNDQPQAGSQGPSRFDASSTNISTTASYALSLPSGLSLSLSGNYLRNATERVTTTSYGSNASAGYAFFDRALQLTLSGGWSETRSRTEGPGERWTRQLRLNGNASYDLPFGDTLQLSVRGLSNRALTGDAAAFQEGRMTLRYSHGF